MSKLSIGPSPALPLERNLESQLENVPMVEVVRAEDIEAVVNADRRNGRKNDGGSAKHKTKIARKNRQRILSREKENLNLRAEKLRKKSQINSQIPN